MGLTELLRTHRSLHASRTLAVTSRPIAIDWGLSFAKTPRLCITSIMMFVKMQNEKLQFFARRNSG
jgi:hypothetical protein